MDGGYAVAQQLAQKMRGFHGVSDVLIPQDIDYPGLALNINRQQASLEGLTPKTIVDSVITAMTSNGMVAPSYWIDPKTGNNYMLTVQYPESTGANAERLQADPVAISRRQEHHPT